jgi:hypothetical protein
MMNILLIGSSFAYYFPDELFYIGKAAGIDMRICNAYSSGITLEKQWKWYLENTGDYQFITTDGEGRRVVKGLKLDQVLPQYRWDVISVHQTPMAFRSANVEESRKSCVYAKDIYSILREKCPDARYMWYQIWGMQVGYQGPNNVADKASYPEHLKVLTHEKQLGMYEAARTVALEMAEIHSVDRVPAGDAWQMVREETFIGDTLCGKNGNDHGDYHHDGDTGGGQYLNACVWFEVLTRKSCIGNPWRPEYDLTEEKIGVLQEYAHRAVAACYGEDYVK